MNLRKIIAICMIILSVFLQVSYAIGNSEQVNANSDRVRVHFSSIQYDISDEFGIAKISISNKDDTSIGIDVDNIYPGIYYNINTVLENTGNQGIKITSISLISNKTENEDNSKLYDMIVGLNDEKIKLKLDDYINYLNSKYVGKIINASESLALNLSMGMDEEIIDLENTSCEYQIIINFEQSQKDSGGDDGGDDDDNGDGDNGNNGGNSDNGKNNNKTNEDKSVNTEDKKTIDNVNNNQENNKDNITQVSSAGGEISSYLSFINDLPKSGEKFPASLYITGLVLMLVGIFLLRKENKTV